jgi:hypothetical protein
MKEIILVLMMWTPTSGMIERSYEHEPFQSTFECHTAANKYVWKFLEEEQMHLNDLQGIRELCLTREELDGWYGRRNI